MSGYYQSPKNGFRLFGAPGDPAWRPPQVAGLGAVLAHWSLADPEPPLISLPTGVGKTAIAMAAPFLAGARRVLVVVPARELRRQTALRFTTQALLQQIGALPEQEENRPIVVEVSRKVTNWSDLLRADVVLALPNSISPEYYDEAGKPPIDLFDLVVVDEAHHAPARTWISILVHFSQAKSLLLTATPRRRDRKRVPGKLIYYYPLRQALEENLYQPVQPIILPASSSGTKADFDRTIADEVIRLLGEDHHRTSQLLIRAASIARATALADLYRSLGLPVALVHSKLGTRTQQAILEGLRAGEHRGVVVVGMLIEGFDLPSLRIAAYHDKHKSLEATAQLIGRLARVDEAFPQPSAVVTVNDLDVYPELKGAVRVLYEEDRDWVRILPGLIDDDIQDEIRDREYARSYTSSVGGIDLAALHPLRRATIFEVFDASWEPSFTHGEVPASLQPGRKLAGQFILYSGMNPESTTLLIVTSYVERPKWHEGDVLDSPKYELHLISYRRSSHTHLPHLLLINTQGKAFEAAFVEALSAAGVLNAADPVRLSEAFDSLERISVSSVGVRNTYRSPGVPSYRMFSGSHIEGGLRWSDTSQSALGHAMVQVLGDDTAFTAGVSTGKGKYWETRYGPLRTYETFVTELSERYWFPPRPPVGPLLPQISRGRLFSDWPESPPLAAELDYALIGASWEIVNLGTLDRLELYVGTDPTGELPASALRATSSTLPILAGYPIGDRIEIVWSGTIDQLGMVSAVSPELRVRRGVASSVPLAELLTERPPMVYFVDGTTIHGQTLHPPQPVGASPLEDVLQPYDWAGVNIVAETRAIAAARGRGISVHERLEGYLMTRTRRSKHRWILINDGAGEIADYLSIEVTATTVHLGLWHAKFSGGDAPGVRVTDFQEVVAQAIKSRRWYTDRRLWNELDQRLQGKRAPLAKLVDGKDHAGALEIILGRHLRHQALAFTRRSPSIQGEMGIIQPGLSRKELLEALDGSAVDFRKREAAQQIQQLLTVWQDSLNPMALRSVVLCST